MRLQNILVATDLSESAQPVYRWAAAVARRLGSKVTLINIDETSEFAWPARGMRGSVRLMVFLQELSHRRRQLLDEARDGFEREDIPTTIETGVGRAPDKILDHTRSHDVDLLVMGKRGTHQVERFTLGDATKRVLRRVRVPTLVIPRGGKTEDDPPEPFRGQRIISATAFSAACMMTLDVTLELARLLGAHVDCVHVIKLPLPFSITPAEWPEIVAGETREELEHMHARDLAQLIGKERAGRCTPYTTLGVSVSRALCDLALETNADLITIPSHSSGKEDPPRFGSTTENVVKRSSVPVLVFPVRYLEQRFGMAARGS